jgi:hypothetical protein
MFVPTILATSNVIHIAQDYIIARLRRSVAYALFPSKKPNVNINVALIIISLHGHFSKHLRPRLTIVCLRFVKIFLKKIDDQVQTSIWLKPRLTNCCRKPRDHVVFPV